MFATTLRTVKTRWQLFLGTGIALTFGIAVMASMFNIMINASQKHPNVAEGSRYGAAAVIVEADQELHARQPDGTDQTVKLRDHKPLPADTASKLRSIPSVSQVVVDRSFSATIVGKPQAITAANQQMGHGWSSALLAPLHLIKGHAPQQGQVVITAAIHQAAGIGVEDVVSIVTPTGAQQFTVSGIAAPARGQGLPGEDSLFFADDQAAQLSNTPDEAAAIGIIAQSGTDAAQLQRRISDKLSNSSFKVHIDDQKGGNAAADRYAIAIQPTIELTGFNISMAGFICIFVVAATASFSITQRRQEIALLRLIGATPKQVRRMVLAETIVVAPVASVAGSVIGALLSKLFPVILRAYGLAPADFSAGGTLAGSLAASGIGLIVAFLGVFLASRRASKVRAAEAMRDAVAEQRVMTAGRWAAGLIFLVIALGLVCFMVILGGIAAISIAVLVAEILAVALVMLMPAFIKPLITLISIPLVKRTSAVGLLARANLRNATRHTTSTGAPILVAVSITISLVGASVLAGDTGRVNIEKRIQATYVMSSQAAGIPQIVTEKVRRIPGVSTALATPEATIYMAGDLSTRDTIGIMSAEVPKAFSIAVKEGSLAHLPANGAVVSILKAQELGWHVGKNVSVYLSDGTKVTLRVAAIVNSPQAIPEILVAPAAVQDHLATTMAPNMFITTDEGMSVAARKQLYQIGQDAGAQVEDTQTWLAEAKTNGDRDSKVGMTMLLGLALGYLAIAIANTLVMAVSSRTQEMTLLRNIGASNRQIVAMVAGETVIIVITASLLGIATASLAVYGVYKALHAIVPNTPFPWIEPAYIAVIAASLVIALIASTAPILIRLKKSQAAEL